MSIGNSNNSDIIDKVLEAELTNPRVLAWSVIIKDGCPVYNNNILKVDNKRTSVELKSPQSKVSSQNSESLLSPKSITENQRDKESRLGKDEENFKIEDLYSIREDDIWNEKNHNIVKKDFSIWRCLYWPEIAVNPIYSGGYGKMRIALCLNKIITSVQEKSNNRTFMGKESQEMRECIDLLPYIRVLYDNELLFQSCIVIKNICIILEIEVHHPLSKIIIEIFDFDNSDPSLINSSDDLIGHIIIPVGAHSNRKPLENRLILASDEDARILYIRKSHQKKVQKENLMAQKLLRFPIKSCEKQQNSSNGRLELNKTEPSKNVGKFVDEEETSLEIVSRSPRIESLDSCNMNELPNSIYFELTNQMIKDAIEFSHSAEKKFKSIGMLQETHCNFVVEVFSEIKWSRLSIIPREIFALYLPEPDNRSSNKYNNKNDEYIIHEKMIRNENNLEINVKMIINSIILLREIYYSECFFPYKDYIWKVLNWESQLHSLFALSVIWYLLFHPKYIFSFGFLLGLIILFVNFDKKNLILSLENSISRNLKTYNPFEYCVDEFLEDNILYSPIKSKNHTKSKPLNRKSILLDNFEENKTVENIDFTILENILTSSIFSPKAVKFLKKFSYILDKLAKLIYGIVKLHFWNNLSQSLLLAFGYLILLLISLTYSDEFIKYVQYVFLITILLPSTYFFPPIKGFLRILKSYKKFKKLKRNR